ncbi:hypothetical protein SK128_009003, partial [Halocaridina rubra]
MNSSTWITQGPGSKLILSYVVITIGFLSVITLANGTTAEENGRDKSVTYTPSFNDCNEECEVAFPDGTCSLDVKCLIRNMFSPSVKSEKYLPSDFQDQPKSTHTHCQGKCLFEDKRYVCRLDLICLMNRGVEGTLRFLKDLDIDAETAILLSLTAGSETMAQYTEDSLQHCNIYSKSSLNCEGFSQKSTNGVKNIGEQFKDLEEEDTDDEESEFSFFPAGVADPPLRPCPKP